MSAVRMSTILIAIAVLSASAERALASDQLQKQMETYVREQMRKARAECARKLDIAPLPANDIDFVAQYGTERWKSYKDCLLAEMHLDAQHLPPPPR